MIDSGGDSAERGGCHVLVAMVAKWLPKWGKSRNVGNS